MENRGDGRAREFSLGEMIVPSRDVGTSSTDTEVCDIGTDLGEPTQVILYNDNVHTFDYVILCLVYTFQHPVAIAEKIALEAHELGRAIAEVEPREEATKHATMLHAMGLKVEVESL